MCPERRVSSKGSVALVALERLVVGVDGLVPGQRRRGVEAFEADLADVLPVALVRSDVSEN